MDNLTVNTLLTIFTYLGVDTRDIPKTFVETGSYRGDTTVPIVASNWFNRVLTVESNSKFAKFTIDRLTKKYPDKDWAVITGDSRVVIHHLCEAIKEPAVFYLDAHWSKGNDACKGRRISDNPLMVELDAIAKRNESDVIVIDDLRCFGQNNNRVGDWSGITISNILEKVSQELPGGLIHCPKHTIHNDRLCIKLTKKAP